MAHTDARSLSPEAQEGMGRSLIEAVLTQEMKKAQGSRTLGVSRHAITSWLVAHERGGVAALAAKTRGLPQGRLIAPKQQAKIFRQGREGGPLDRSRAGAARDESPTMVNARAHLRRRRNQPGVVRTFFEDEHVHSASVARQRTSTIGYSPQSPGRPSSRQGLPGEERTFAHRTTDPRQLDQDGDGHELASGPVFLLPCQMSRYRGFPAAGWSYSRLRGLILPWRWTTLSFTIRRYRSAWHP